MKKTAEQLAEERKYQKPKQELNHIWNIDYILKCLFVMDDRKDWFYFEAYGREFIQNLVAQQVTAATEEIKRERDEYYDTLQEYRLKAADMEKRIQELEAQVKTLEAVKESPAVIVIGEPSDKTAILERLKKVHADFAIMDREEFLKEKPTKSEAFIINPLPIETLCYVAKENKPSHRRPYKFHR